jgi:hypothetical protein
MWALFIRLAARDAAVPNLNANGHTNPEPPHRSLLVSSHGTSHTCYPLVILLRLSDRFTFNQSSPDPILSRAMVANMACSLMQ